LFLLSSHIICIVMITVSSILITLYCT